ncbi:MAG: DUF2130 domain-containing protein [Ignavibacteria bacterium]|nr:DUF2130 domain-containing protein [Ignavibacteria bacterium]
MDRFGLRQGVWVCSFSEIKGLSIVLREMLIKTQSVRIVQENKGEKKDMLYNYLTSNEFVQQIEAIVEGFTGLLGDLQKERMPWRGSGVQEKADKKGADKYFIDVWFHQRNFRKCNRKHKSS